MNTTPSSTEPLLLSPDELSNTPELVLQAVSTRPGTTLVNSLIQAVDDACGWIQDRQMIGASTLQLRVEAQGRAVVDLYAAFLSAGLELSRTSHQLLTERCLCAQLQRASRSCIVSLRLSVLLATDNPLRPAATQAGYA